MAEQKGQSCPGTARVCAVWFLKPGDPGGGDRGGVTARPLRHVLTSCSQPREKPPSGSFGAGGKPNPGHKMRRK